MHTYEQALQIIQTTISALPAIMVQPRDSLGHVAAGDVFSPIAVPPFANSAMDGFALQSTATKHASAQNPVRLEVTGTLTAGEERPGSGPAADATVEIMTGAAIPPNCDSVVPLERVEVLRNHNGSPKTIIVTAPVATNQNLRHAGEDFEPGEKILARGETISAARIMGLAAIGLTNIEVLPRPVTSIVTTGNELATGTENQLSGGQIHNANGPYLDAACRELQLPIHLQARCADDPDELADKLLMASETSEIIVTTGGVSAGRMDFVPQVLEHISARILFHKVSIRPGKPLLFAQMPGGTLIFGLPGNPVAVAVGFRFFVIPALRKLQGQPMEFFSRARLTAPLRKKPGMTFFAKAYAHEDADGNRAVDILAGQESFRIKPLMQANCWAIAPADADTIAAGEHVQIAPLIPPTF